MFMPARDLYELPALDTAAFGGDVEEMRAHKRMENSVGKLSKSIAEEGVRKPVQLAHGSDPVWDPHAGKYAGPEAVLLANGNHRAIAAYDLDPSMEIPVEHHGNADSVLNAMYEQDASKWGD